MKYDLKSLTRKELGKLKADIDKALVRVEKKEMKEALAAAEKAAKAHGFSLSQITGDATAPAKAKRKSATKPKKPGVAKYANPDNKDQSWTGKGRQPDWFKTALAAGKIPDEMEI